MVGTSEARPIRQSPRHMSPPLPEVNRLVEEISWDGVIKPTTSPRPYPIALIKESGSSLRLCIDYVMRFHCPHKWFVRLPRFKSKMLASGRGENRQEKWLLLCQKGSMSFRQCPSDSVMSRPPSSIRYRQHKPTYFKTMHNLYRWHSCL